MNLSDFRTRTARVSGMSLASSADLALIDAWANEAVEQFLRETKINVLTASLSVTAGVGDYLLDSTILSMEALYYQPASGTSALLEPVSPEDMAWRRLTPTAGAHPRQYAIVGAHLLRLWPVPLYSTDTIHLLFVARAASALTAAAHDPSNAAYGNIPLEYHTAIEAYVKWKACEAEEVKAYQNGLQFQAEWERTIGKIRGEVKRKAGMVLPSARVGRRRSAPFAPPGVDR